MSISWPALHLFANCSGLRTPRIMRTMHPSASEPPYPSLSLSHNALNTIVAAEKGNRTWRNKVLIMMMEDRPLRERDGTTVGAGAGTSFTAHSHMPDLGPDPHTSACGGSAVYGPQTARAPCSSDSCRVD